MQKKLLEENHHFFVMTIVNGEADILKLRFRNEHLVQKINLCQEQIRFLKELIILQKSLQRNQAQANEVVSHINQSTPMSFPSIK